MFSASCLDLSDVCLSVSMTHSHTLPSLAAGTCSISVVFSVFFSSTVTYVDRGERDTCSRPPFCSCADDLLTGKQLAL